MDQRNDKDKSLARSKQSLISLHDIVVVGALSAAGGPVLGLGYKLLKTLGEHARAYYNDRRDSRIMDFHEKVLEGVAQDQGEEFLKAEFSVEDYYSILEKVVQDEEDIKLEIYAKIFRCLIMGLIPCTYKLHLLKASRELNFSDFELMRLLYINEKYEFRAPGNKLSQIAALTRSDDPIRCYSIQKLIALGFLTERETHKPAWPTSLLKLTVELLYDKKDLTAESLGKAAKTTQSEMLKLFIACDQLNEHADIHTRITNTLSNSYIKHVLANPLRKSFPLTIAPIIALCVGSKGSPIESLRAHTNLDKKIVIRLLLPGGKLENVSLKYAETFNLAGAEGNELERLVKFIEDRTGH